VFHADICCGELVLAGVGLERVLEDRGCCEEGWSRQDEGFGWGSDGARGHVLVVIMGEVGV